jgi:2,5-diamino-6-(ribosylamino)-4(3H)-pyrimidinone 5'-phosphate reductase
MSRHHKEDSDNKVKPLSTHLRGKLEKIEQILECLIQESSSGVPIIVEGDNDFQTLRHLGVQGKIMCAKTGGKSRLDLLSQIEDSSVKEFVLLFDFDRRGKEWTETVKESLEKAQLKPDLTFWNQLRSLVSREVKDVEGLDAYLDTLRKKTGTMPLEGI